MRFTLVDLVVEPRFAVDGVVGSVVLYVGYDGLVARVFGLVGVDALGGALVGVVGMLAHFDVVRAREVSSVWRRDEVV